MILRCVRQESSNWNYCETKMRTSIARKAITFATRRALDALLSFNAYHTLTSFWSVLRAWRLKERTDDRWTGKKIFERKPSVHVRVLCVRLFRASIDPNSSGLNEVKIVRIFLSSILICFYLCQRLSRTVQSRSRFSFRSQLLKMCFFAELYETSIFDQSYLIYLMLL